MYSADQLLCSEFRVLVQEVLDGFNVSDTYRMGIREHRNTCRRCCEFHDHLLHVTALAPEIMAPGEFQPCDQAQLWNRIFSALDDSNGQEPACRFKSCSPISRFPGDPDGKSTYQSIPSRPNQIMRGLSECETFSAEPPPPILVPQLGRLDSSKIDESQAVNGQITDLGKLLLGPDELHLLHRLATTQQPNFRVNRLTDKSFETLMQLQDYVSIQMNVIGTIVISPDGAVLSSRFRQDAGDREALAIWALAALHNAQAACKVLGYSTVGQLMSRSEKGYVIVANLHEISLVILVDGNEDDAVRVVSKVRALG